MNTTTQPPVSAVDRPGKTARHVSAAETRQALAHAGALLKRNPGRWLLTIVLFAVVIEIFMFVPQVGLAFKIAASGLLGAQMMAMFQSADLGHRPNPLHLFRALNRAPSATAALLAGVWLPLTVALAWVAVRYGAGTVNTLLSKPTALPEVFLRFKWVLFPAAMPLTFTAAAVVIGGGKGISALTAAVAGAARNPLLVVALSGSTIAAETAIERLVHWFPNIFGAIVALAFTMIYFAAIAALNYTLAARVFAAAQPQTGAA